MLRQELGTRRSEPQAGGNSNTAYSTLIDRICELCATTPSPTSHERCELTIDGTLFTLIPSLDDKGIDGMAYFAEVGALPKNQKDEVATRLLESNLFMLARDLPSFCINPRTGQVVLGGCLAIERLTAKSAHESLTQIAVFAGKWRELQFMPGPVPPEFSASSGGRDRFADSPAAPSR